MVSTAIRTLPYYGGKSAGPGATTGTGAWLLSLLPYDRFYAEPFGGLGGILVARDPSPNELLNDLNGRVMNWWHVVRDQRGELIEMLRWSPSTPGRGEYEWALEHLDDPRPVSAAYALSCVLIGSRLSSDRSGPKQYTYPGRTSHRGWTRHLAEGQLRALSDRLRGVLLEREDATVVLERFASNSRTVVYCDPPYPTATREYTHPDVDTERLTAALLAQSGKVLISGYASEWDHLSWEKRSHPTRSTVSGDSASRSEVAWTNYDARPSLFGPPLNARSEEGAWAWA